MSTSTKFNSQLEVTQTVTLGGTLNVTGTATFNEQVAIVATNDTVSIVATGVAITASTTITGAVGISGNTTITGDVGITGTTTITGSLACTELQLQSPSDKLTQILTQSSSIFFDNVAGNAVATANMTVSGALLSSMNSVVIDTPDILNDAFIVQAVVVADDTVGLKLHNTSNATVQAITATYEVVVLQFS